MKVSFPSTGSVDSPLAAADARSRARRQWLYWTLLGAALGSLLLLFIFIAKDAAPKWEVTPLGLSLRVASLHPVGAPPNAMQASVLHQIGLSARHDLKECIAGEANPPVEVELVFDEGIVSLGSGPVSQETQYGRCVAQVLEGLWGEIPGQHRLLLSLSLP